jgi:hypothetical protein
MNITVLDARVFSTIIGMIKLIFIVRCSTRPIPTLSNNVIKNSTTPKIVDVCDSCPRLQTCKHCPQPTDCRICRSDTTDSVRERLIREAVAMGFALNIVTKSMTKLEQTVNINTLSSEKALQCLIDNILAISPVSPNYQNPPKPTQVVQTPSQVQPTAPPMTGNNVYPGNARPAIPQMVYNNPYPYYNQQNVNYPPRASYPQPYPNVLQYPLPANHPQPNLYPYVPPAYTPVTNPLPAQQMPSVFSLNTGSTNDDNDCKICFEASINAVLIPCGHLALCVPCADKLKRSASPLCPLCRQHITAVVQTFKA